ncbi:unnamed protein product [Owenia fusiformis]|uniref:L-Fucosyltransferase n=1 Tax=Owenia fusiformis TaxID=6347 RepID=A0A8J1XXV6_OWEFU|nr:unnamed protein product [Owenia fusiformis]
MTLQRNYILIVFILLLSLPGCYIYINRLKVTEHMPTIHLIKTMKKINLKNIKTSYREMFKSKEHKNTKKPVLEKLNFGFNNINCSYIGVQYFRSRLGNIMFQYASTFGIARENNLCVLMPESVPRKSIDFRSYFHLSAIPTNTGLPIASQSVSLKKGCCIFQNSYMQLNNTRNYTLSGGLQSYKYFNNVQNEIRKEFKFSKTVDEAANIFLRNATPNLNTTLVGIHIRRGDFLKHEEQGFVVPHVSYFNNAMKYTQEKFTNVHFIVCSDDIKWCKENIKPTSVTFSESNEAIVDMAILSKCNHVIMSTGTFGWWAGFLSRGTVIYYKHWPRKGSRLAADVNISDYYLPDWIPMD